MVPPPIRPNVVPTIAWLHFVFGGLGVASALLLGSHYFTAGSRLFAVAGRTPQDQQQAQLAEDLQKFIEQRFPYAQPIEMTDQGLNLLLSVLMIVSGLGLMRWRKWGRTLSIVYAWLSIALKVFSVVYAYTLIVPLVREYLRGWEPRGEADIAFGNLLGTFLGVVPLLPLILMIYPLVVLFVMLSAPVTVAFLGPSAIRKEEKDPYARFRPPPRSDFDDRRRPG